MDLPKNESVFYFESTGAITEQKYAGEFTVVCVLSILQKRQVELERGRLVGESANPSSNLQGIATVISALRGRIIKAPDWWQNSNGGLDFLDENVLVELFDKVMVQEAQWIERLKKQPSAEQKDPLGK